MFESQDPHERYMSEALREAIRAMEQDEIPVGAVIVWNDKIIARAHNQTELLNDFTAHAEMIAVTSASNHLGNKYLNECTLYVTLEPCPMCAGAISWTHLKAVYYGCSDPKKGYSVFSKNIIGPPATITSGILEDQCSKLIKDYFKRKRK